MQIKKLLSNTAYWVINKELAREIGLEATLLLQHLIDLRENYFKEGTPFYQQQSRLSNELGISEYQVRLATKKLVEMEFVSVKREGIPPKYHWTINDLNLYRFFNLTYKGEEIEPLKVKKVDHKHKEKQTQIKTNTELDVPSDTDQDKDFYGKIFFRIVDAYPKNRIGNRQHGLRKFNTLSKEDAKLAALNLKRYLTIAGPFVKTLQNYIQEGCFTESWLKAEEQTKSKKASITTNKPDTKTFKADYDDID